MVAIKRNKQSRTSSRPILNSKKQKKVKLLRKDEIELQKKIAQEGLSERATAPKGNLALKAADDKDFKKKTKSFKKVVVSGQKKGFAVTAKKGAWKKGKGNKRRRKHLKEDRGLICITNLPDGFFEDQLELYFGQFGKVSRLRLVRSKRTGRSCGYAYIEFKHSEVANIVTKVMHNYLTFGKIIKCINMDYSETLADSIFSVERFGPKNCPKVLSRAKAISELNKPRTTKQLSGRKGRVVNNFNKKMKLLSELGVNMDLKLFKPKGNSTPAVKKDGTDSQNADKSKGSEKTQTSKKKAKILSNEELQGLKRGLDSLDENENSTLQDSKIVESKKEENSDMPAKSPKKRKSSVAEQTTPKSTKKLQKKGSIKTPKGTKEKTVVSTKNGASDVSTMKEAVVFEADQSDDEITLKTPPFAKKKLVKITPSSPACRVTGLPKVKPNSAKQTPQRTPLRKRK